MRSVGTRGVTIVTIVTLIFVSFLGKDGREDTRLVGAKVETHLEECRTGMPCPIYRLEIRTVVIPLHFRATMNEPRARCEPLVGAGCP